jgi:hypothetical protein
VIETSGNWVHEWTVTEIILVPCASGLVSCVAPFRRCQEVLTIKPTNAVVDTAVRIGNRAMSFVLRVVEKNLGGIDLGFEKKRI